MFRNADFCNIFFPGWTCRVYVDAVEKGAIEEHLLHDGAQLMLLPTLSNGPKMDPMLARHMIAADPDVDRFIVRDLHLFPSSHSPSLPPILPFSILLSLFLLHIHKHKH